MANIFKISKIGVKILAGIISLAFLFNTISGLMGSLEMADGETVNIQDIQPGDFIMNFGNLSLEIGMDIDNKGIYEYQDIIIGMIFEMKSNVTGWNTILNTTSVALNSSIDPKGQTIKPGENKSVVMDAGMDDFELNITEIATLFGLSGNWNIGDLLGVNFESRMTLSFTISYAFKQYQLSFDISLNNDVIKGGFL
ncbi:MAG: hypothetical protein ACTSVU_08160 [Promethearchaeota archaeon]